MNQYPQKRKQRDDEHETLYLSNSFDVDKQSRPNSSNCIDGSKKFKEDQNAINIIGLDRKESVNTIIGSKTNENERSVGNLRRVPTLYEISAHKVLNNIQSQGIESLRLPSLVLNDLDSLKYFKEAETTKMKKMVAVIFNEMDFIIHFRSRYEETLERLQPNANGDDASPTLRSLSIYRRIVFQRIGESFQLTNGMTMQIEPQMRSALKRYNEERCNMQWDKEEINKVILSFEALVMTLSLLKDEYSRLLKSLEGVVDTMNEVQNRAANLLAPSASNQVSVSESV